MPHRIFRLPLLPAALWIAVAAAIAQSSAAPAAATAPVAPAPYVPSFTFDVATIRQSPLANSYTLSGGFSPHSSRLTLRNFDVTNILALAFEANRAQISGLPAWAAWPTVFNIEAESDSSIDVQMAKLTKAQLDLEQEHMLQMLLVGRFNLKYHWETKIGSVYNLVAKNPAKLIGAKGEPVTPEELAILANRPTPTLYQRGDSRVGFDFVAHQCSIDDLAQTLASQFGRPVLDKTGLTGKYDFTLRYHDIRSTDRSVDSTDPLPTLDVALEDQLGLKLVAAKGPIRLLVIDRLDKPSEN